MRLFFILAFINSSVFAANDWDDVSLTVTQLNISGTNYDISRKIQKPGHWLRFLHNHNVKKQEHILRESLSNLKYGEVYKIAKMKTQYEREQWLGKQSGDSNHLSIQSLRTSVLVLSKLLLEAQTQIHYKRSKFDGKALSNYTRTLLMASLSDSLLHSLKGVDEKGDEVQFAKLRTPWFHEFASFPSVKKIMERVEERAYTISTTDQDFNNRDRLSIHQQDIVRIFLEEWIIYCDKILPNILDVTKLNHENLPKWMDYEVQADSEVWGVLLMIFRSQFII